MATKSKISPVHWGALLIGFPSMAVTGIGFVTVGPHSSAIRESDGVYDFTWLVELGARTIVGNHVIDAGALLGARVWLGSFLALTVATIWVSLAESGRLQRIDRRGEELVDQTHVLQDNSFWMVGDRGGWRDGGIRIGTVIETHRRPFEFEGAMIDAFAGAPGLVMKEDGTGLLAGVPNGRLYRLVGTSGPTGTIETIHDEMVAAVQVGDGTSWIDHHGDVQEGTILEIRHEPFEVGGKRVDASARNPGYVIARSPDGVHVGVSDKLREGI